MVIGAHKYLPSEGQELLSDPSSFPAGVDPNSHSVLDYEVQLNRPTPLQCRVDEAVAGFTQQATDWKSLVAMTAGSMAFRFSRLGSLQSAQFLTEASSKILNPALRGGTWLTALGTEAAVFESSQRGFTHLLEGTKRNPHLWDWRGPGGIAQGLLSSFITFGSLKGAGAVVQNQNLLLQHLFQDTGMVLGHQVSARLGIASKPEGSLAEQYLHAEATNLQLQAGMALLHGIAPRLSSLEKALDLQLQSKISEKSFFSNSRGAKAKWLALGLASAPMEGALLSPSFLPDRGRPAIQKNFMMGYGEGSLSLAERAKQRFHPFFTNDPQNYGAQILEEVLEIHPPFPYFHERFLETLAQMSDRGNREHYQLIQIIKEVFHWDALNTSTGSLHLARLQLLVCQIMKMDSWEQRLPALEALFHAMDRRERNRELTPDQLDHLFSSFGLDKGWEITGSTESRPINFVQKGDSWSSPLANGHARLVVDSQGRWFLERTSREVKVWILDKDLLDTLDVNERRLLTSDTQFAVGEELRSAQGYALEKNDSGETLLRLGDMDLQLFSELFGNAPTKFNKMIEYYLEIAKSGLYDHDDLRQAFQFARTHPQGKLVLRRIMNILATQDHPLKLKELRHETGEKDTLDTVLRLEHERIPLPEIARRVNGTHHTAYIDDMRLALKLVSVLWDVASYVGLLGLSSVREKYDALLKDHVIHCNWARMVGKTLDQSYEISDLIELLQIGGDPAMKRLKEDWENGIFSLEFERQDGEYEEDYATLKEQKGRGILKKYGGELNYRLSRMKINISEGMALFISAKKSGEKDRTILRRFPPLAPTEDNIVESFYELIYRLSAIIHEWEHGNHFSGRYEGIEAGGEKIDALLFDAGSPLSDVEKRHNRLVSELLADLEMWRWQFKLDLSSWERTRRMGVNLPLYLMALNDHGYFGQTNRSAVRELEKRLAEPPPPPSSLTSQLFTRSRDTLDDLIALALKGRKKSPNEEFMESAGLSRPTPLIPPPLNLNSLRPEPPPPPEAPAPETQKAGSEGPMRNSLRKIRGLISRVWAEWGPSSKKRP